MPTFTARSLQTAMVKAVSDVLSKGGTHISSFAKAEFKLLAQSLIEIQSLLAQGELTKAEAKSLMRQHKNATTAVLAGIRGMSLLIAEQAVNGALKAVKQTVNHAAEFALL